MLLTDAQLHEIRQIIEDHHNAFVVNVVSPEVVAADVLQRLKDLGMVDPVIRSSEDAYLLGQVLAAMDNPKVARMDYREFKEYLRKNPVPLSNVEQRAVQIAQHTAAQYAVGLGRKVDLELGQTLLTEDLQLAQQMRDTIRTATAEAIARRETAAELKSTLGWETRDWVRDWDRIAITELHNARERGVADKIAKTHGGGARVAKLVMPDACEHCVRLHVGPDGHPRIFKLSDLEKNGTNFKKKVADWKAVVGSVHPHCFVAGTFVTVEQGVAPIENVRPGDVVLTHDGTWRRVTHTWKSKYHGTVHTVTAGGIAVTSTPNHPFLVGKEWLAAECLHKGMHLQGFFSKIGASCHLDTVNAPPETPKNECLATVLFGFSRSGVPVSAIYFNGELYVREGEINQEQAYLISGGRMQTEDLQFVVDPAFGFRAKFATLGLYGGEHVSPGLLLTSDRGMESNQVGPSLFWRHLGHADPLPLGTGPRDASSLFQAPIDGATGYVELFGYRLYRQQLVNVQFFDEGTIQFSSESIDPVGHTVTVPGEHPIVNVVSDPYTGWVYNLTVAGTNSYVANGFVVHNCQCSTIRVPEGWGFDDEGRLTPEGEHGVDYGSQDDMELALHEEMDLVKSAKEGHVTFQGLPITIENDVGTVREWKDSEGNTGSTVMLFAYGYLDDTDSMDGEELDVYLGPDPRAQNAFIVHQQNPHTGIYDEEKTMLGFTNEQQAVQAYRFHFDKPDDYLLTVTPMALDQFKRWAASSQEEDIPAEQAERECRFIIPLRKAELATESGHIASEAVESRAGDRAPGPQLGVNYVFPVPQRDQPPAKMEDEDMHMTPRQMLDAGRHRRNAVKRDKRDYEYRQPLGSVAKPMVIPDSYRDFIVLDEEEAERRKEHLIKEGLKNTARPQNKVEVGSES